MDRRVTSEEIFLTLAWAEEGGDRELLAALRLLGGLGLRFACADPAGGDALLAQATPGPGRPLLPIASLFLALQARGPRLAELAEPLRADFGATLALGTSLLLDRSEPASAARLLALAAAASHPAAELAGRCHEYALLAADDYPALIELLERRPPPGFASPAVRRAEALWRAGNPEARRALARLVEEQFDSYARVRLEEVLEADGDWPGLAELYRLALRRTPSPQDRSLLLLRLGEILEDHLGDPAGAAKLYAQAEGGSVAAAITARRRALLRRGGDWEAYANCLREEARHVEDRRRAAALELIAGRTLLEAVGDPLEAARAFQEALRLHPEDGRCQEFLAEAYLLAGDFDRLAELHAGPLGALIRRDPRGLEELPPAVQAVTAVRAEDHEALAAALRRWAEQEEPASLRAALLTLAAQLDPDRQRARQDLAAALFLAERFLPALLTLARLSMLEGRLRPTMDTLTRAAELVGPGQIRMILLLEAADVGQGLGDPAAVAALHRAAADTLFGSGPLPVEASVLAGALDEGGVWGQHTLAILREARRAGHRETLPPLLIELARRAQGPLADEALRLTLELLPAGSELEDALLTLLEGRGRWEEVAALLERRARHSLDPAQRAELLARVALIAEGPLGDRPRANRALEQAAGSERIAGTSPAVIHPGGGSKPGTGLESAEALLAQAAQTRDWDEATTLLLAAGERLRQAEQWTRAEETYQQVLARDAAEPRALAALAALARQLGDWAGAREWLGRLAEVEPDRAARLDLLLLRARLAAEGLADPDAAARDHEACLLLDPRCVEARDALERHYRAVGDFPPLRLLYLQGLEQATGTDAAARQLELLVSLAELEADALGHPERAIPPLERALSLRPGDPGLLRRLADVAGRAQHWQQRVEALQTLARQVKDAAERSALYLEIAELYRDHLGGGGVVLENTMVAFVCDNANRRAFEELEQLYVAERRWREVIGIYDVALGALRHGAPYQAEELLRRKGLVLARSLDAPQEAVEVLLAALALLPEDGEVLDALELLLTQTRDVDQRLRMLEIQAEARHGRSRLELLLRAAELSAGLPGREVACETYYRRALEAVPGVEPRPVLALEAIYQREQRWAELVALYEELAHRSTTPAARRDYLLRVAGLLEGELHDRERATAVYQQLLEADDGDPDALQALARLYEAARGWDELLAVSRRELQRSRRPEERALLLFRIGSIQETHRRDELEAEQAYLGALAEDPRCFPALHGLRELYLRRQDWARAVQTLEQETALWEEPRDRAAIFVHLGDLLLQKLHDRPRAAVAYRNALRTVPGYPDAARALLPLLIEAEAWQEAAPLARLATRSSASAAGGEGPLRLQALLQRALVALRLGELAETAGALELALQLDPADGAALAIVRELVLRPGSRTLPASALEGMLALLERSPTPGEDGPASWLPVLRGRVAEARGDVDEALRHFRVATRTLPAALEGSRPLVCLLSRLRRWDDVVDVLLALIDAAPCALERARARLRLAQIELDRRGRTRAAAEHLQQVVDELGALRTGEAEEEYGADEEVAWREALFLAAQAAYLEQRWPDGAGFLARLITAEDEDPRRLHGPGSLGLYLYYRGRFLRDGLGQPDQAAASFYQAVQEGPGLVEPVLALARLLWHEGDEEELVELLEGQLPVVRRTAGSGQALRLWQFWAGAYLRSGREDEALALLARALEQGEEPVQTRRLLAQLARQAGRPELAVQSLQAALLAGGPVQVVLAELAELWQEQGDLARVGLAGRLATALTGAPPGAAQAAGAPVPSAPLDPGRLLRHALHPDAAGPLTELWPVLAPLLEAPSPLADAGAPLNGDGSPLQTTLAQLAGRFGAPLPPVRVTSTLAGPVALQEGTLLVSPALHACVDPLILSFWLGGALLLQQAGLALAVHPRPEVAASTARFCAAVIAAVGGVSLPAWLPDGHAPRAALALAEQALAGRVERTAPVPLPDPARVLAGLQRSRHRAGLLLLDDPVAALRALAWGLPPVDPGNAAAPSEVLELVWYCLGGQYDAARDALARREG